MHERKPIAAQIDFKISTKPEERYRERRKAARQTTTKTTTINENRREFNNIIQANANRVVEWKARVINRTKQIA